MCHHLNLKIQKDTWILNLNASASRGVSFVFCTFHLSSYCSCHPSLSCSALAIRHGLRQSVELHRSYLFPSSVHCSTFFTSSSATFLFPKPLLCFRTNFPTLHPFCRHQFSCRTLMRTKKRQKSGSHSIRTCDVDPFHITTLRPTYVRLSLLASDQLHRCRCDTCMTKRCGRTTPVFSSSWVLS